MSMRTLLAALMLAGLMPGSALAQDVQVTESAPINIARTFTLQSEALSEERTVYVSLPLDYESSTTRYPVVYMLDAQVFSVFQYAYGEVNVLAAAEAMPPVILVGVPSENRILDMGVGSPMRAGAADAFVDFLKNELQGFIDAQFRTEPYTILIGHSRGGNFALHALARHPDAFDAYIMLSPALWNDSSTAFREFEEQLASGAEFNHTIFASVADEGADFAKQFEEFVALIEETKPAGLELTHMNFPTEDHLSTLIPGIHHGLLSVYKRWALPPDAYRGLEALQSHYGALSEHYGYPVAIPTAVASRVGENLMLAKDYAAAVELFEYTVANLAQGPNEYHLLGRALRGLGRAEESLAAFEKAVAVGSGSRDYEMLVRDRDQAAEELNSKNE
jgi:predicted alpha/beta superfamily hydrolase